MEDCTDAELQKFNHYSLGVKKWMKHLYFNKPKEDKKELMIVKHSWKPMLSYKSLEMNVYIGYMEDKKVKIDLFGMESVIIGTSAVCSTPFGYLYQLETKSSRYFLIIPKDFEPEKLVKKKFKAMVKGSQYASKFNSVNLKGTKIQFFPSILLHYEDEDKDNEILKSQKYFIGIEVINDLNKEYCTIDSSNQEVAAFFHYTFQCSLATFLVGRIYGTEEDNRIRCMIVDINFTKYGYAKEIGKFFHSHKCNDLCKDLNLTDIYLTDELLSEPLDFPSIERFEEVKVEVKKDKKSKKHCRSADIIVQSLPLGTEQKDVEGLLIDLMSVKKITVVKRSAFVWLYFPLEAENLVKKYRFLKFRSTIVELDIPTGKKNKQL